MYCIKCGVKLADTEKVCPLCSTRVFHPELERGQGEPLYPTQKRPTMKMKNNVPQAIITAVFVLAFIVVFLCDIQLNEALTWSRYAMGAIILGYILFILPSWFTRPNPVIFVPCGFASVGVYLLYINIFTDGNWFLSFAFPMVGVVGLIVTAVVTLVKYLKKGKLYIFGGAFIAFGSLMILCEFLLNITFGFTRFIWWSIYPLSFFALIGFLLIYFAISRTARETMERKFFI